MATDVSDITAGEDLSPDFIAELLSGTRTRGAGEDVLRDFLNSGSAGRMVDLSSGHFAGKTADQAYVSLNNAKKKLTQAGEDGQIPEPRAAAVRVIKRGKEADAKVFLVDTQKVQA